MGYAGGVFTRAEGRYTSYYFISMSTQDFPVPAGPLSPRRRVRAGKAAPLQPHSRPNRTLPRLLRLLAGADREASVQRCGIAPGTKIQEGATPGHSPGRNVNCCTPWGSFLHAPFASQRSTPLTFPGATGQSPHQGRHHRHARCARGHAGHGLAAGPGGRGIGAPALKIFVHGSGARGSLGDRGVPVWIMCIVCNLPVAHFVTWLCQGTTQVLISRSCVSRHPVPLTSPRIKYACMYLSIMLPYYWQKGFQARPGSTCMAASPAPTPLWTPARRCVMFRRPPRAQRRRRRRPSAPRSERQPPSQLRCRGLTAGRACGPCWRPTAGKGRREVRSASAASPSRCPAPEAAALPASGRQGRPDSTRADGRGSVQQAHHWCLGIIPSGPC